jgi:hypothetical protein
VEDTDVIEHHDFTQLVGRGLFIMYHMTSIIVLLNMVRASHFMASEAPQLTHIKSLQLIAMMSHSFQVINDHADLEWKFHRLLMYRE